MHPRVMDKASLGVKKRMELRLTCRTRLSEHIYETLGIRIMPSQVRLRTEDDSKYSWHVKEPDIKRLFDKQLSGHSVGAYITLIEEVGRSFWAVRPTKQGSPVSLQEQIDLLRLENMALVEDIGNASGDLAESVQEKEKLKTEISKLEVSLSNSNTSIVSLQEESEKWRALAESYQSSLIQWSDGINQISRFSDGINQISRFLQGIKTETPVVPLGYDWTQWK